MHRCYYAQRLLCIQATMHRGYYAQRLLCLESTCIEATMHRGYYAQSLLCIEATMHRGYYAQSLLCIEATMCRKYCNIEKSRIILGAPILFLQTALQSTMIYESTLFKDWQSVGAVPKFSHLIVISKEPQNTKNPLVTCKKNCTINKYKNTNFLQLK